MIQALAKSDGQAIKGLLRKYLREMTGSELDPADTPEAADRIWSDLGERGIDQQAPVLGAYEASKLQGFAIVTLAEGTGPLAAKQPLATLNAIYVEPEERGKGVGTALLREIQDRLRVQGIRRLVTLVDMRNANSLALLRGRGSRPQYTLETLDI